MTHRDVCHRLACRIGADLEKNANVGEERCFVENMLGGIFHVFHACEWKNVVHV